MSILDDLNDEEFEQCRNCDWDERWIPEAAYFNWINAGQPSGRDEEFWYEAERQIVGFTAEEYADMVYSFQWEEYQRDEDRRQWERYEDDIYAEV